ncbi:MAG TPA: ribonucleoside triphosphate reductase, partial [Hadesarchaea archaeon]|nr:ribonucleoside triphosphate reductase [Hadesarchaea archaeon]
MSIKAIKKIERKPTEPEQIDPVRFVDDYLRVRDWRVHENANVPYSFSSLFLQAAGEMVTRYTLSKVYPREIAKAHIEGDFHIHNLAFGIIGYCAGWSIKDLLLRGFSGVVGRT